MAAPVKKKILKKMAAPVAKKILMKKEKPAAAKKKTSQSPARKGSGTLPEKTKKRAVVKKKEQKTSSARRAVAKIKIGKKKPEQKTSSQKNRLPELKRALILKRDDILKEVKEEIAKYISGENKQLVDTANDDGDWAQVDISEDISLQRLSAHRKLLYNIDEAIRKIAEGTYGICEECGEEISGKRLLVLPSATLCIDCQENKEQFEALEGEE